MGKNNIRTKVTKVFNISSKLRECDPISIETVEVGFQLFYKKPSNIVVEHYS